MEKKKRIIKNLTPALQKARRLNLLKGRVMKAEFWRAKRLKAYEYFLSLGPSRSLRDVISASYGDVSTVGQWSSKYKWFDMARDYDRKSTTILEEKNPEYLDLLRQVMIHGISTAFFQLFQLQKDGTVKFQNDTESWRPHDMLAFAELLNRLTGFMGKTGSTDLNLNLHVSIMNLIDKLQTRGYNPFTISQETILKSLPSSDGNANGSAGAGN